MTDDANAYLITRRSILADHLERWMETDLRAIVVALRGPEPLIQCGRTHPDPRTERRIAEARSDLGAPSGREGCGRLMVLWEGFRCVECGRWFHRSCIERHFEDHESDPGSPRDGGGRSNPDG